MRFGEYTATQQRQPFPADNFWKKILIHPMPPKRTQKGLVTSQTTYLWWHAIRNVTLVSPSRLLVLFVTIYAVIQFGTIVVDSRISTASVVGTFNNNNDVDNGPGQALLSQANNNQQKKTYRQKKIKNESSPLHEATWQNTTITYKKNASWENAPNAFIANNDDIRLPQSNDKVQNSITLYGQDFVQDYLQKTMGRSFLPLTAVLEELPNQHDWKNQDPWKKTANYPKPLPIRNNSILTTISYPHHIQSCQDIPNRWPVGHPKEQDALYGPNMHAIRSMYRMRWDYANTTCPVDADPFLPWIHDVFTSVDGQYMDIIAHNKRRCRRDPNRYVDDIHNLEPQVTLMQSVPIQRLTADQLETMSSIPSSWKQTWKVSNASSASSSKIMNYGENEHRYRLVPLEMADEHSKETRFLCHFHALVPTESPGGGVQKIVLGETWSVFPYNYEFANYRHRRGQSANPMLTRPHHKHDGDGIHNEQVWNAILHARCPIPKTLQSMVQTMTATTIPTIYMDLVPVRTPPREKVTGYAPQILDKTEFDPIAEWGLEHVLPPVSQSGRWANIPLCPSPIQNSQLQKKQKDQTPGQWQNQEDKTPGATVEPAQSTISTKSNFMVGCLWASAVFSERGSTAWDAHTPTRLLEWLTYHLELAGFDHIVVYDNTEAHTNSTNLQSVVDMFPTSKVTRIPWKHRVCNNNAGTSTNAGERSSQYAAEASCRVRYGPTTEWMAFFDTDEYLVPSGNWSSIRDWLQGGVKDGSIGEDTHILSFYETKAFLDKSFTEPYNDENSPECNCEGCQCLSKIADATFLESFCEPFPFPRKYPETKVKMKQIYRPAFVLNHFVHYAAVTRLLFDKPRHPRVVGWPYERRAKELTEAFMLHTKTRLPETTRYWNTSLCDTPKCPIGFPWPHYQGENTTTEEGRLNEYGFPFNCYRIRKIDHELVGKLHNVLDRLIHKWKATVLQ